MKLAQPIVSAGQEKRFHLIAPIVKNIRAPVLMQAETWIFVFIQRTAVESCQRERIAREMRRYPVQNDAYFRPVASVNEKLQIPRRPVTAGGGKIARGLISPGFIQGML